MTPLQRVCLHLFLMGVMTGLAIASMFILGGAWKVAAVVVGLGAYVAFAWNGRELARE